MKVRNWVGLVAALAMVALTVQASPAAADREAELLITREKGQFTQTFGRISGSFPAPQPVPETELDQSRDPIACNSANYCDTIPIRIILPSGLKQSDDVRVEMFLELTNPNEDCCVDVDLYFWDNKQRKEDPAPDETPYTEFQRSATPGNKEKIQFVSPQLEDYNLTVVAWLGPVSGYRIRAEMIVEEGDAPFELLDPDDTGGSFGPSDDSSFTPPQDLSGGFGAGDLPPLPSEPFGPSLGQVPSDLDSNLEFDVPSLEEQLSNNQFAFEQAGDTEASGPVSTAGLVATLLSLPAIGAAGGGSWMMRRRSAFTL